MTDGVAARVINAEKSPGPESYTDRLRHVLDDVKRETSKEMGCAERSIQQAIEWIEVHFEEHKAGPVSAPERS